MLTPESPEASLGIPRERVLLETRQLYDLLTSNRDPLYGYEPVSGSPFRKDSLPFGLMDLDPRHDSYAENLQALKTRYPNCQIEDNVDLEIAKATAAPEMKIERLEECLTRFSDRDAVPEVLFRLGVACKAAGQEAKSETAFARLAETYPDSVWTQQASVYTQWRTAASDG
jgi:hypothetical protein